MDYIDVKKNRSVTFESGVQNPYCAPLIAPMAFHRCGKQYKNRIVPKPEYMLYRLRVCAVLLQLLDFSRVYMVTVIKYTILFIMCLLSQRQYFHRLDSFFTNAKKRGYTIHNGTNKMHVYKHKIGRNF
jgi:hypothetical protein